MTELVYITEILSKINKINFFRSKVYVSKRAGDESDFWEGENFVMMIQH